MYFDFVLRSHDFLFIILLILVVTFINVNDFLWCLLKHVLSLSILKSQNQTSRNIVKIRRSSK